MSIGIYEFPLNEKIRNYLRVEDLMASVKLTANSDNARFHIQFFEHLFTLLDLLERIDIRTEVVKELDVQERNLVHWSQHPNIDDTALKSTLQAVIRTRDSLKAGKKPGTELKSDAFLQSIRQRFAIPGATCSFDLPQLHYWLNLSKETRQQNINEWLSFVALIDDAISMLLTFLRQRGQFVAQSAVNGFFQGDAEDKSELVRIRVDSDTGAYPTLSGNKHRYALRFMKIEDGNSVAVSDTIEFKMATCK
jgi:cell division protein ZapD